jgi:hypothetical protein
VPGLLGAEEVARAADLEVLQRDLHAEPRSLLTAIVSSRSAAVSLSGFRSS